MLFRLFIVYWTLLNQFKQKERTLKALRNETDICSFLTFTPQRHNAIGYTIPTLPRVPVSLIAPRNQAPAANLWVFIDIFPNKQQHFTLIHNSCWFSETKKLLEHRYFQKSLISYYPSHIKKAWWTYRLRGGQKYEQIKNVH